MTAELSTSARLFFRLALFVLLPFMFLICSVLGAALLYVKEWLIGTMSLVLAVLLLALLVYLATTWRRLIAYRLDLDQSGIHAAFLVRSIPWSAVERVVRSGLNGGTLHVYLQTPESYLASKNWVTTHFGFMIPGGYLRPGTTEILKYMKSIRPGLVQ